MNAYSTHNKLLLNVLTSIFVVKSTGTATAESSISIRREESEIPDIKGHWALQELRPTLLASMHLIKSTSLTIAWWETLLHDK